ncbi:hypothetical protein H310_00494 [Aphanomyces invadans]|uniref:Tyrosine-protein kinase ephrin type A/B receptor-like domain-containing protein n=1 Tax=Aphanomyces invadans TaxID=157072 RepID=A0A024UUU3_9STRA|nr:hypothetical protein H310_00494 [Aphanomyces invadans]ETW10119.1 hypothetical protein H310_00494 [Aphanomyces invadans]|eukprot:XP_008861530.1 hypothetical protein H310_00494 [Aphanomyces invadans]
MPRLLMATLCMSGALNVIYRLGVHVFSNNVELNGAIASRSVRMYRGIQPSPVPCPVGMYRPAGSGVTITECRFCPRRVYGNLPGLTTPTCTSLCPKGTYNDRLGATSIDDCRPCPKGTYGQSTGMTSRVCTAPCPYGTYSMTEGLSSVSSCIPCPGDYRGPNGRRGNNLNGFATGGYVCDRYYQGKDVPTGRNSNYLARKVD